MTRVQAYYEQNTPLFLVDAVTRRTGTIHRAVWLPGVVSLPEALRTSHRLILGELRRVSQDARLAVLDLGCGLGGTLCDLAAWLPPGWRGLGVTLSARQARLASQAARRRGLAGTLHFIQADYHDLPLYTHVDLVCAIESFAHAHAPERVLAEAARLLRPGGRLVLIDDVRAGPAAHPMLQRFQRGWHLPRLQSRDEVTALAASQGLALVADQDLTPHLRLRTPPAAPLLALLAAGRRLRPGHLAWDSLEGSLALQHCLARGLVHYRCMVFVRAEGTSPGLPETGLTRLPAACILTCGVATVAQWQST